MELFHKILTAAVQGGASDIHIKVGTPVVFRISRQLVAIECPYPTEEWMNKVVEQIVPKHAQKKLEEDREVDFSYNSHGLGRFRTNVFQQRGEFAMAMRYVKMQVASFDELGLLPVLKKIAEAPRGIVLVAGTTGSGKSTTLAAMIEHVNSNFRRHIVTMEDPIEYVFEDNQSILEQREVGLDTKSFQHALKHVLRQDPDIIMVGEMRDATSFSAAMSAADTGHLVLSTLHTTNSSQSITRILDFFKADERDQVRRQLSTTLQAVICQRMVPTIAGSMTPALEIMINTPTVRKMLEENRLDKLAAAIETGQDDGMQNFNQALLALVQQGKVSKEEALQKATNPQTLEMNFQGIFLSEGKRIFGLMNRLILFVAQGFGSGRIPVAPGTFGSVVGVGWLLLLLATGSPVWFVLGTVFGLALSVYFCGAGEKILNEPDPGSVVMDEIAAIPLCLVSWLTLQYFHTHQWPTVESFLGNTGGRIVIVGVFVFFRIFDVWKPWPVRQSQSLPGGWGITVDDALAAVYVNVVGVIYYFWRSAS